jgi:hypothetical protein
MRLINVALPDAAADQLKVLAARERRAPRQQAAWLVLEGLRRAGLDSSAAVEQATAAPGGKR